MRRAWLSRSFWTQAPTPRGTRFRPLRRMLPYRSAAPHRPLHRSVSMLVIGRKTGETVLLGEDIQITIASIRGDTVRLAIEAPRSVTVLRKETVQRVAADNAAALTTS